MEQRRNPTEIRRGAAGTAKSPSRETQAKHFRSLSCRTRSAHALVRQTIRHMRRRLRTEPHRSDSGRDSDFRIPRRCDSRSSGNLLAMKLIPPDVLADCHAKAAAMGEPLPRSWREALFVILLWLVTLALLGYFLWETFSRTGIRTNQLLDNGLRTLDLRENRPLDSRQKDVLQNIG